MGQQVMWLNLITRMVRIVQINPMVKMGKMVPMNLISKMVRMVQVNPMVKMVRIRIFGCCEYLFKSNGLSGKTI